MTTFAAMMVNQGAGDSCGRPGNEVPSYQEVFATVNREKEEIIYFDTLGLGWVVDLRIIMAVFSSNIEEESIRDNTIFDHPRNGQCGF